MRYLVHVVALAAFLVPSSLALADDNANPYEQRYGGSAYVEPHVGAASATAQVSAPVTQYPAAVTQNNVYVQQTTSPAETRTISNQSDDYTSPTTAYQQRFNVPSYSDQSSDQVDRKRAELNISTIYDHDPSSDVKGGSSYGIETTAYSATINNKWRLFAGEYFSHEQELEGEGHINYSRSTAGVEYSYNALVASIAPTYNTYNSNERVGVAGNATWTFNDNWAVAGGAELFSRDVPLRALNSGITANDYNAIADFYQEGRRDVRLTGDVMTFSDNNVRTGVGLNDTEHLYISKHYSFDGLASVYESNNSENEDRPYFNPRQDIFGNIGGRIKQPLYKGHGFTYDHSLDVKPGIYWQQSYGTSPVISTGYTQHVNYRNDIDGSAGVIFTRQDADGMPENDIAFLLNLGKKF